MLYEFKNIKTKKYNSKKYDYWRNELFDKLNTNTDKEELIDYMLWLYNVYRPFLWWWEDKEES
jgi:hypothetical protein